MFDIGWSELLVIAAVAVIVVGPKELPRMLRSFGKTMGQVRRMSNDFRRQFDEALREAERESGLDETRKDLQKIAKADPLKGVQRDLDKVTQPVAAKPAAAGPKPVPASPPAPDKPDARAHEAEPLKTGAAAERGSDAA
jgi:sec-independent protein translocase protein TatB